MKTQDGGNTWQPVTIPAQAKYLRALEFVDNNHAWAVGHNGTILYSDNRGINWTLQTCPVDTTLYDIDFADTLHGLIAGDGCVLYTHDGGNIWHIANVGIEEERYTPNAKRSTLEVSPNPFTNMALIRYSVSVADKVTIKLYDVMGNLVEILMDEYRNAGSYTLEFNNRRLKISKGVYFLKYENGTNKSVTKFVIQ